jgi:hypothetical protein
MAKRRKKRTAASDSQSQAALLVDAPPLVHTEGLDFTRRYLLRSVEVFLYWMPVWVPLILLAQLGTRGLKPARAEDERLKLHEERLLERLQIDKDESRRLNESLEALDDPIFIERLRRKRQERQRDEIERRDLSPEVDAESAGN